MTTFAALALLATAQGAFKPPTGPIVAPQFVLKNLLANPSFESADLAPWATGGLYEFLNYDVPNGPVITSNSTSGYVSKPGGHKGSACFKMNVGFPGIVGKGNGNFVTTYLRQPLPSQPYGSGIFDASVWIFANFVSVEVRIDYTTGAPTYATSPNWTDIAWQRWSFLSAIDRDRRIKEITFTAKVGNTADSYARYFEDILLDDASLSILVRA